MISILASRQLCRIIVSRESIWIFIREKFHAWHKVSRNFINVVTGHDFHDYIGEI